MSTHRTMKICGLTFLLFAAWANPELAAAQDTFAAPPVITSPAQGATVVGSPIIAGIGAEAGATVQVNAQLYVCSGIAAGDGSWSCASNLGSGSQTVTAFQVDLAGNHSANSEPVTYERWKHRGLKARLFETLIAPLRRLL